MHFVSALSVATSIGAMLVNLAYAILLPNKILITSTESSPTAILLAVPDGPARQAVINEWVTFVEHSIVHPPKVWVLCLSNASTESLHGHPPFLFPFVVDENSSWATVFRSFGIQNPDARTFGFLGEGVLPSSDLSISAKSIELALAGNVAPTVVLPRSRSKTSTGSASVWLPDTFISQIWCNHNELMVPAGFGMEDTTIHEFSLITMLPQIIHKLNGYGKVQIVDGTSILKSLYLTDFKHGQTFSAGNSASANDLDFYFSRLGTALVAENSGRNVANERKIKATISRAPWPPQYVLETVAKDGVVIVSNVNCGYLDLATNFLRSIQNVSDSKVLWVAMDDVAFDFMDNLVPGTVAMFPFRGMDSPHATKAGDFGDDMFKAEVLVRPSILKKILKQGYALLWTDTDMVWLADPFAALPNVNDPSGADIMLMLDGGPESPCTCLLFMKPVYSIGKLLDLWQNEIMQTQPQQDQEAWKHPLILMLFDGMRMGVFNNESFPSGRFYFDHPFKENDPMHENVVVVHNNWIIGHDQKVARFKEYGLWKAGDILFPRCDRRLS